VPFAARAGDLHVCPMVQQVGTVTFTHLGGPVLQPGAPSVLIGGLPAAIVGNQAICTGAPPLVIDSIIAGSTSVKIMGMPAARVGDATAHGGKIQMGSANVTIGG
jgi:uncharacterized Zn-binding protein involved in type VI secretion